MENSIFAVNEEPYSVWDPALKSANLSFINSIDSKFFEYSARAHVDNLNGDDKQRAATAIRMTYHHGLETLFALICASLQAPDCVVGWIQKYRPVQLRNMVSSITKGDYNFLHKLNLDPLSWDTIAAEINRVSYPDQNRIVETKKLFGSLWKRFATELVDNYGVWEYNSIKHGFRASSGGFSIAMGIEPSYGVSPPPEQMQLLGSSEFGNSFYRTEPISSSTKSPHLRLIHSSVAWNPQATLYALVLLTISIGNVVSFLKLLNGVEPSIVPFTRPIDSEDFEKPWIDPPSVPTLSINPGIEINAEAMISREELLRVLKCKLSRSQSTPHAHGNTEAQ
jgi:hypothetical protein